VLGTMDHVFTVGEAADVSKGEPPRRSVWNRLEASADNLREPRLETTMTE